MNLNENLSTEELVGKMIENLDILEEFLKAFPIKEESIEVEDRIAKYERPEGYPQKLIALEEVVEKASEEFEAVMRANAESEKKLLAKSMFLLERVASCKKRIIASSEKDADDQKVILFLEAFESSLLVRQVKSLIAEFFEYVNETLSVEALVSMDKMINGIKAYEEAVIQEYLS